MADCCSQLEGQLKAIQAQLSRLESKVNQKANKGEVPNLVKGAMAGMLPLLLPNAINQLSGSGLNSVLKPQLQNILNQDEIIQNILKDTKELKGKVNRLPDPSSAVLGGREARVLRQEIESIKAGARAAAGRVSAVEKVAENAAKTASSLGQKLAPLLSKLSVVLQIVSVASGVIALAQSTATILLMARRFNDSERFENITNRDLSRVQTQLGTLDSRTKNLQAADKKLEQKIEQSLDNDQSNKLAIQKTSELANRANGTANTALIQARRAESNLVTTTTTANQALQTAKNAQSSVQTVQSQATTALNTANKALTQSSSVQREVSQLQSIINTAQSTANRALSTAQSALARPLQQVVNNVNNVTNVINNTVINPVRERVVQTVQTVRQVNTVQTVREVKVETIREVQELDAETKAAIQRIEARTIQTSQQVNNVQSTVNQQTTAISEINTKTTNVQNGVNEMKGRLQNLAQKTDEIKQNIKNRFDSTMRRLDASGVLDKITLIIVLHNAVMLSGNILQTLFAIIDEAVALIPNPLRDKDDPQFSLGQFLGKSIQDFLKSLIGEEAYKNITLKYAALNRAVQATSNAIYAIRSMTDTTTMLAREGAERIGIWCNAAKREGVVSENAYKSMSERVEAQNKYLDRLYEIEQAASTIGSVVGSLSSIKADFGTLTDSKAEFEKAKEDLLPKEQKDNKPVATKDATDSNQSKGAVITEGDV